MEEIKKTGRGGARPGAGRKRMFDRKMVTIRVPRDFVEGVQAYVRAASAKRAGLTEVKGRTSADFAYLEMMKYDIEEAICYLKKLDEIAENAKLSDFEKRQMKLFD